MSLLSAKDLALAYGPKTLFEGATFTLGPHDKVGLIGPNGTGKSSLLKILCGVQSADKGLVQLARGARVGYLPQEVAELPDGPIVDVLLAQVPGRAALETRLEEVEVGLEDATRGGGAARAGPVARRSARRAGALRGALRPPPGRADPGGPRLRRQQARSAACASSPAAG